MKYFLDTEFIEHAGGIDLVSIGIVCEDGREFYAESSEFDPRNASDWVKTNVLAKLEYWGKWSLSIDNPSGEVGFQRGNISGMYGNLTQIKWQLLKFFGYISMKDGFSTPTPPVNPSANIQIFAYFADYDWVVFSRIFGRMIDLPNGMPMWCIDLKQMMWERELDKEWKRVNCPDPENEHNALIDARWNKKLYEAIIQKSI